ncbi:MAG: hypothetical protein QOI05_3931 [Bradyrhizobium sp.]|jgi:hypothetical protein|nr:hypothetical protein [Bradyrhizobium sp.]
MAEEFGAERLDPRAFSRVSPGWAANSDGVGGGGISQPVGTLGTVFPARCQRTGWNTVPADVATCEGIQIVA